MNYDQINVKFVSPEIGDLEIFEEKLKVINKSGIFSNNGPVSSELQALISQRWSNNNISLTSSATVGLLAVLCKLKNERDYNSEAFSKRNKIAVCGYGWPSSVQCPQILGFDIELFDTLADQPIFDWSEFLPMLNKEFLAVIVTNTFGLPSFNDSHVEMLKGLNIKLICDAAHCFGIDNLFSADQITADYYIVSTHATKVFQTAEGGIIISNSMQDKLLLDRLVNFNLDNPKDAYALNGKMSELGAALGISQLGKLITL